MTTEPPQPSADSQSQISAADSQTAQEYIARQLQLEADAKEALPYQFDTCTKPLGPLRQSLFSCLTCNPAPISSKDAHTPAGLCYSCSISCHGEHELVELFSKRDFECDCGTTRTSESAPCMLRSHPLTGLKGNVVGELARSGNKYNHNFTGRFCGCGDAYDPHKEKGTMFQCLGLGNVEDGGCGEDWWHPECLMGLPRHSDKPMNANADPVRDAEVKTEDGAPAQHDGTAVEDGAQEQDAPLPPGFPAEEDFEHLICYKCVDSNPWTKQYAGALGFLPAVYCSDSDDRTARKTLHDLAGTEQVPGLKRKRDDDDQTSEVKRPRDDSGRSTEVNEDPDASKTAIGNGEGPTDSAPYHSRLLEPNPGKFSLFLKDDFRDHFCRCRDCFPRLARFPQLLEEEDVYEPPISESDEDGGQGGSVGSKSLLDRGEAALSTMDRARAIEGVMAYNHLKTNLKSFLQPFAESGQAVGAEDIKAYFAKLRGDESAIRQAAASADGVGDGNNRHEQSGY